MPGTLLIVEDQDAIRRGLTRIAERMGYVVTTASTLSQAVRSLDGQSRIVLDLDLPDGDGGDLLARVGQGVRVAIFTGEVGRREERAEVMFNKAEVERLCRWLAA